VQLLLKLERRLRESRPASDVWNGNSNKILKLHQTIPEAQQMSMVKGFVIALTVAFAFVLVSSVGSTPLLAQGGQRMDPAARQAMMQAQFDSMCVFLGLNAKQKTEAKAAFDARQAAQTKMFEEMQGGGGDREAMMAAMTKLRTDYTTKLDAILTADQKAKLAKWDEAHPQRGGRRNN